jgi:hypothetical protein
MFRNLMQAITGQPSQIMAGSGLNAAQVSLQTAMANHGGMLGAVSERQLRRSASKKIFSGNIEVQQVANGFVVNIGTREGYEYETHIASTIAEVNEIIAAAMVAFQLEK